MLLDFFETIGIKTLSLFTFVFVFFQFLGENILLLLFKKSYNPSFLKLFVLNIYNTTIKQIPFFFFIGLFFGIALIGTITIVANKFGLELQMGEIIISAVLKEGAPLLATLFLTLRLSVVILQELATFNTLDERRTFVLANLLSSMVATLFFALFLSAVMIMSGYIFTLFYLGMNFHTYSSLLFSALDLSAVYVVIAKGLVFGLVMIALPLMNGFELKSKDISATLILKTTLRLLLVLFFLEVVFFVLRVI